MIANEIPLKIQHENYDIKKICYMMDLPSLSHELHQIIL